MIWMLLIGALLGLAVALVAAGIMSSWLIFAVCFIPFMLFGVVIGALYEWQSWQREVLEDPDSIDKEAQYHVTKRDFSAAAGVLMRGSMLLSDAAKDKEPGPDREELEARAERWQKQAKEYINRNVDERLAAFRRERMRSFE